MSSHGILTNSPNFKIPMLGPPKNINGYKYKNPIPIELVPLYRQAIVENGERYFDLAGLFHESVSSPEYTADNFMKFFKDCYGIGYEIHRYYPNDPTDPVGRWQWKSTDRKNIDIYVSVDAQPVVQKTTIIHECIHVIQEFDHPFTTNLLKYPPELHTVIAERVANKTMAEIVLPKREYEKCKRLKWTNAKIADYYNVSIGLVKCYNR